MNKTIELGDFLLVRKSDIYNLEEAVEMDYELRYFLQSTILSLSCDIQDNDPNVHKKLSPDMIAQYKSMIGNIKDRIIKQSMTKSATDNIDASNNFKVRYAFCAHALDLMGCDRYKYDKTVISDFLILVAGGTKKYAYNTISGNITLTDFHKPVIKEFNEITKQLDIPIRLKPGDPIY